jgi:hypothetical protein
LLEGASLNQSDNTQKAEVRKIILRLGNCIFNHCDRKDMR